MCKFLSFISDVSDVMKNKWCVQHVCICAFLTLCSSGVCQSDGARPDTRVHQGDVHHETI